MEPRDHIHSQHSAHPVGMNQAFSKFVMRTEPDSDDEFDDDNDDYNNEEGNNNHFNTAIASHNGSSSSSNKDYNNNDDNDEEDELVDRQQSFQAYKQRLLSRMTSSSMGGARLFSQNTLKNILEEVDRWVLSVAPPVARSRDDAFPSSDYDILHVQYLAAARGSWDEGVGMRRRGLGFVDEQLQSLLEQGYTPVHLAAHLGNLCILRQLIEEARMQCTLTDSNGETALHFACKRGHLSVIRYLTESCQLSVKQENKQGVTPLQFALKGGHLEVVAYLMEEAREKISCDFQDSVLKASMLHWACLGKRVELVEYLIMHQRLSVETLAESDQSTCLLWAAFASTVDVVKYLVEHASANPQAKDVQEKTCLHMATMSGDVEKTTYFMDQVHLFITDKDLNHKTPFDVATGAALLFLQERKKKGFVTGSIVERTKKAPTKK